MSDTFEQNTLTTYIVKVWAKVYNQYFKKGGTPQIIWLTPVPD